MYNSITLLFIGWRSGIRTPDREIKRLEMSLDKQGGHAYLVDADEIESWLDAARSKVFLSKPTGVDLFLGRQSGKTPGFASGVLILSPLGSSFSGQKPVQRPWQRKAAKSRCSPCPLLCL